MDNISKKPPTYQSILSKKSFNSDIARVGRGDLPQILLRTRGKLLADC
jgi:hypothetical protein